jgi:cysteine desulfuration protein SufE
MIVEKLPKKLSEILIEFDSIEDPSLRMELLIEYGEQFRQVPPVVASKPYSKGNKIPACESDAYIFCKKNNDSSLNFYFAVENPQGISAKALACILQDTLSGEPLSKVVEIDESLAYKLFGKELSMGKGLGLSSMIRELKRLALNYYQTL